VATEFQGSEPAGKALLEQATDAWLGRLAQLWDGGEQHKLEFFRESVAGRTDALSYLRELQRPNGDRTSQFIISATVDRIQSEQFDIADLFAEIRSLMAALGNLAASEPSDSAIDCDAYRRALDDFFEAVIQETSLVYELFSERGGQALCILDCSGRVTFANHSATKVFGDQPLRGRPFTSALDESCRERVIDSLERLALGLPQLEIIRIKDAEGQVRTMAAELVRLPRPTDRSSYCISISPMARVFGLEDDILEDFEEPTIRVDSGKTIYYANRKARKVLGRDPFGPVHIYEVLKGDENRRKVDEELRRRSAGRLGKYETQLTKPSGREIPISVTAIPEFDIHGNRAGSLAFLRNIEAEKVRHELESCLQEDNSWTEAAAMLCRVLMDHVAADMISIYRWADDLCHVSPVVSFQRDGAKFQSGRHWWRLSKAQIAWNQRPGLEREGDLNAFLAQEDWQDLAKDPEMRRMIDEDGIKSFVRLSIKKDGAYKAGLSLTSKTLNGFSEEDEELLSALPLAEIVLSIIQRKDRDEKDFQFNLMKEMAACNSFDKLAMLVTKSLADHYNWDHVSIFDVIDEKKTLKIINQAQGSDVGYALSPTYEQDSRDGLLGQAVTRGEYVYASDVTMTEDYLAGHNATRSEIVFPIFSKAYDPPRAFWLLNIEHSQSDFLIEHEIDDLQAIAQQVEFAVNRMVDRSTYENAMRTTSDGVIITDGGGEIRHVNPAVVQMLRYSISDLLGRGICELFEDQNLCQDFLRGKISDSRRAKLKRADEEKPVTVLLSVLQLPDEISDTYFIFKSLEAEERLADLEAIELLIGDIAQELKTPLSLLHGMLRRLSTKGNASLGFDVADFVDRARAQLKQVELTYDRVAYADGNAMLESHNEVLLHLDQLFRSIRESIAAQDDQMIDVQVAGDLPPVVGDPYQIRFVFMTLISYLLRNIPPEQKVKVNLHSTGDQVRATVSAPFPERSGERFYWEVDDLDRTKVDMSLGRRAIEQCIANHRGHFDEPVFDAGRLCFNVSLPAYDPSME
jgi:PAS domain S-box-containing protein